VIRRRELLGAAAAAGACALARGALLACAREDPLERALSSFYADAGAAREVGLELLRLDPGAEGAGILVERVARGRGADLRALAGSNPEGLAEILREQHRRDFAEGRIARVRGWVLSETEASLLALAAL
jgi:hypothetical protein